MIEDLVEQDVLAAIRAENAALVDDIYAKRYRDGQVDIPPDGLGFWDKLDPGYAKQLDVFQPLTNCLPRGDVLPDSPMHIGPAIFDLIRHKPILDLVEDLIGCKITASPMQHIRNTGPAELAAKVTGTLILKVFELTMQIDPALNIGIWRKRSDYAPMTSWMREQILSLMKTLDAKL